MPIRTDVPPPVPTDAESGVHSLNGSRIVEGIQTVLNIEPSQLSLQNDVQATSNGGAVTFNPSFGSENVYGLETDGNDNQSEAALETAKILDYRAGHTNEAGIRVRVVSPPTAGVAEWGLGAHDGDDRAFFRQDRTGSVSAVVERGGNETSVSEKRWGDRTLRPVTNENGDVEFWAVGYDPWHPDSTLGESVDTSKGFIYKIEYSWYGQGIIAFHIVNVREDGSQRRTPCVGFVPVGNTSFENPNQPIFARAANQGFTSNTQLAVAGRQAWYSGRRLGKKAPVRHVIESPPAISASSYTTIALFRRDPDFPGTPAELTDVGFAGGGVYDVEVRGRVDADGSPAWDDGPNRDTEDSVPLQVEEDVAVATSGGELTGFPTGGGFVNSSTQGNRVEVGELDSQATAIVRSEPAAVVAKEISSGTATTPTAIGLSFAVGM